LIGTEPQVVALGTRQTKDIPTAVFIERDGGILVGDEAVSARPRDLGRYLEQFKLDIANDAGFTVDVDGASRTYSWPELVAAVLRRIRIAAETQYNNRQPLRRAILTIPIAYVEEGPQWQVMRMAGTLAGLETLRLVREPHAAAIWYDRELRRAGAAGEAEGSVTLVYDLGGGTFDPALIRRRAHTYELVVPPTGAGGLRCGGIFFDEKIAADFCVKCPAAAAELRPIERTAAGDITPESVPRARRLARDRIALHEFLTDVKHRFGSTDVDSFNAPDPVTYETDYRLTRAEFNGLIDPLLDETIRSCQSLIRDAGVSWGEITRVMMIGGSCHIPLVREKLTAMVLEAGGKAEICWNRVGNQLVTIDPQLAVCRGAALALDAPGLAEVGDAYFFGSGVARDQAQAIGWYRQAAAEGHVESEYRLGRCHQLGEGVVVDPAQTMLWYHRAAVNSHVLACQELALLYESGQGGIQDEVQSAHWSLRAAELGNRDAQLRIGDRYRDGHGVAADPKRAAHWWHRAAEQGSAEAQVRYAGACEKGDGRPADDTEAEHWYRIAADQGHPTAQFAVGFCHWKRNEFEQAAQWFGLAVQQGHQDAASFLGYSHLQGMGVPVDLSRAKELMLPAAKGGDATMQFWLGECFRRDHQAESAGQAFDWNRKAAEQGNGPAELQMANCLMYGRGVARDRAQAVTWYRKCVERGDTEATNMLGVCLFDGLGIASDHSAAIRLFQQAAEKGNPAAMRNLGWAHVCGLGLPRDWIAAKNWYYKAGQAGRDVEIDLIELAMLEALKAPFRTLERVYLRPDIPVAKLAAVHSVYKSYLQTGENVVLVYDDTIWRGAKDGFIVTNRGIGCKSLSVETPSYWSFDSFDKSALQRVLAAIVVDKECIAPARKLLPLIAASALGEWRSEARAVVASQAN
jgi:TPR repeat protein